ncbi:MAG: ATP-binding domain-containing protein [Gemmataceae bacterium]
MSAFDGLEVIHGTTSKNSKLFSDLAQCLRGAHVKGTLYIGYPVMASAESNTTLEALLVSQQPGLVAFHFADDRNTEYKDEQDRLYYVLKSNLARHEGLRVGRKLGVDINVVSIYPEGGVPSTNQAEYKTASISSLPGVLSGLSGLSDEGMYRKLCASIQRVTTIKPHKKRQNVQKSNSKGAILKQIEKAIANLDRWQKSAAIETPEGPQRIKGLAGSGKTVVLALKAAYLHTQHPGWDIAVTFHTRSLYQQFIDLIERFTLEHMGDKPDWSKLKILHSWGSATSPGIYSLACDAINFTPMSFAEVRVKYGVLEAFAGACGELSAAITGRQLGLFDAVLIDEAQDFPPSFFRVVDAITRQPKRIVWAYDELQNLSDTGMSTTAELFGRDLPLVNAPNSPHQDLILPVCYRNTPWALTLAHALGFGLFRKAPGTMVQHFDQPSVWTEIGYVLEGGNLIEGQEVTLRRGTDSYPSFFTDLISPDDALVVNRFESRLHQYSWIAEQIKRNITEDEIDPDDILIILPNAKTQRDEYFALRRFLDSNGIASSLVGVTNDLDSFVYSGSVTVSGIFRAKGNEAPMVYLANSDYCAIGHGLIRLRNILFTAITRSRAWVRICGVGDLMTELKEEIDHVVSDNYRLKFRIPTPPELARMRTINRDRTPEEKNRILKAQKGVQEYLELIEQGVLPVDSLPPQLRDILKRIGDDEVSE